MSSQVPAQLAPLLRRQIDAMQDLLRCLQTERHALDSRDADALTRATEAKLRQLAVADELERQRRSLVADDKGMRMLARQPGIGPYWQELIALTLRCRELNNANGMMIRWQRRRVEGALNLLRGAPASATYGPDGANRQAAHSRAPLASA